jgi:UDP-N-acetyl-D-mannosaminuronate dehydrogenase
MKIAIVGLGYVGLAVLVDTRNAMAGCKVTPDKLWKA